MDKYFTVYTDIPGLDKLVILIEEHKRLVDAMDKNVREIHKAMSIYNVTLKAKEAADDKQ